MARLLNLIVLSMAAVAGFGLSTTGQSSGVSFTLDEATLRPIALAGKAAHQTHAVRAIGTAVIDEMLLEVFRGILHMADGTEPTTAGAKFFSLMQTSPKAKEVLGAVFGAPQKQSIVGSAKSVLMGQWRTMQIREHAKNVEEYATGKHTDTERYQRSRAKVMRFVQRVRKVMGEVGAAASKAVPFELLPQWRADVPVGTTSATIIPGGVCYPSYNAVATSDGSARISVTITPNGQATSYLCSEQIVLIAGGVKYHFELFAAGTATKTISIDTAEISADDASEWFLKQHGVRAYIIATDGILATVGSLLDTLTLLEGFTTISPPANVLSANLDFINSYIQGGGAVPRMGPLSVPRPANNSVVASFDPSNIRSGDLLLLLRRDGIDPMIGWGEGSMAGHSVIAVRTGPGRNDLQVCESTTVDGYWPDNGVQCHTWDKWVDLCVAAGQNVVLVPLNTTMGSKFNTSKALEFFNTNKGIDYGYSSFLFGWLDTATQNFPCTPSSNYTTCLMVQMAEQISILMDSLFGSDHINFFRQALAHRTGQWTTSPATTPTVLQTLQYAQVKLGISFEEIIQIVERDEWQYQTTVNQGTDIVIGKSMVCCVFVCNMWKAGGLFDSLGDKFSCAEQTLWDLYSMKWYDEGRMYANRPEVCKQADPTNPLCQLMGDITMHLVPDVNTRNLYPNMGERCAALPPQYIRPAGC